jgi:hypothetical protein
MDEREIAPRCYTRLPSRRREMFARKTETGFRLRLEEFRRILAYLSVHVEAKLDSDLSQGERDDLESFRDLIIRLVNDSINRNGIEI